MTNQFIEAVSCDDHFQRAINAPLNLLDLCIELAAETIHSAGKDPGTYTQPAFWEVRKGMQRSYLSLLRAWLQPADLLWLYESVCLVTSMVNGLPLRDFLSEKFSWRCPVCRGAAWQGLEIQWSNSNMWAFARCQVLVECFLYSLNK